MSTLRYFKGVEQIPAAFERSHRAQVWVNGVAYATFNFLEEVEEFYAATSVAIKSWVELPREKWDGNIPVLKIEYEDIPSSGWEKDYDTCVWL